ncbi:hypothetical protein HGRIS_001133 [Hohenbuehelia grisea]|uniref:Uncharacterized protein n=1 Tax=Hohenbuehelia grisea TaxID=104357 RepID=A0ABR3JQ94_9AGAR
MQDIEEELWTPHSDAMSVDVDVDFEVDETTPAPIKVAAFYGKTLSRPKSKRPPDDVLIAPEELVDYLYRIRDCLVNATRAVRELLWTKIAA